MDPSGLIFLVLMMVIFYFMLIRPQKRRAQQHRDLVGSLEVGDDVVTIGGLHGTVTRLGEDDLEIEAAPGVNLRFQKTAVARKVNEDVSVEEEDVSSTEEETT